MNVLKASVEDVKMEGVDLKTNKLNMDSSQDQMQYDPVPKLYSNAAHNFPASAVDRVQYSILEIFLQRLLSMMDSRKE